MRCLRFVEEGSSQRSHSSQPQLKPAGHELGSVPPAAPDVLSWPLLTHASHGEGFPCRCSNAVRDATDEAAAAAAARRCLPPLLTTRKYPLPSVQLSASHSERLSPPRSQTRTPIEVLDQGSSVTAVCTHPRLSDTRSASACGVCVCAAAAAGCELAPAALGRRLRCRDSNTHLAAQFAATAATVEHIELNRWDLFHGHLLVTRNGHLGMLMHAQEFPQWCVSSCGASPPIVIERIPKPG